MPDLSYVHIRGLTLFQEIFRLKRKAVRAVNDKMRIIYTTLVSVSNNINTNYLNHVITQENYRDFMIKTQCILTRYNELRAPFTIRTLTDDARIKVSHLHYVTTELVKICGCSSCYELLNLLIGNNWDLLFGDTQRKLLQFYNTMFVPIHFRLEMSNSEITEISVTRYNTYTHSPLLKLHGAEIHIPYGNNSLIIRGYFRDDALNIARIGGTLEKKYKQLTSAAIQDTFHHRYIEQIPLRDFLCNDIEHLLTQIQKEAQEHKRLRELPIGHVAEEFYNGNLSKQYHILTLLLTDTVTYPHAKSIITILLQDPEKTLSNIYRILHWTIQGYFDDVARTVDTNDITEDENTIPYETRIETLKCSESIKKKAREKLKEIRVAREGNDKAIKYLDGILKIPFGTYRKEKILRFMTDYQNKLNTLRCNIIDSLRFTEFTTEFKKICTTLASMKTENQIDVGWENLYTTDTDIAPQLDTLSNEWIDFKCTRKKYLSNVHQTLNNCIYGQDDAKRKIESLVAQWINGEMSGCVFGFQGYPGTGKTSFAKQGLAKCLVDENGQSRPFFFVPLGGSNGGSTLEGHGYTYVGSHWGTIADCLREAKVMNPIIYFDELDKVSGTPRGEEIIRILTHLTDPEQNDAITDRYFNCDMDLSKALIIFSYNDRKNIDEILMDRIYEIRFNQYNKREKVVIVQDYILTRILQSAGYTSDTLIFSDEILEYLIEGYTVEAGVRDLKDKLTEIVREINLRKMYDDNIVLPFHVTENLVDDILKRKNKINITDIPKQSQIGWVNGLYATSIGTGGITIIQVFDTPSDQKFHLELTGKLGDVMKESVRCAKTISWRVFKKIDRINIDAESRENALHIHFPAAGTSKDGPSAGAAISTAIISYFSKLPFRNYIAMTGEIDLHGNVKIIGGLQCKIEGAQRAGVKIILIPRENEPEWLEIQTLDTYKVSVIAVDNISQIIRTCLIGATSDTFEYTISDIDNDETVKKILETIDNNQILALQ
jgi:ATP-dependent Lon protease